MSQVAAGRRDQVELVFPAEGRFRGIGRLVVSGLASRFELPVDRVNDLVLAVETLLLGDISGAEVTLQAVVEDESLCLRLGPFARDTTADEGVVRLLTPLVDTVANVPHAAGGNWIELTVGSHHLDESDG